MVWIRRSGVLRSCGRRIEKTLVNGKTVMVGQLVVSMNISEIASNTTFFFRVNRWGLGPSQPAFICFCCRRTVPGTVTPRCGATNSHSPGNCGCLILQIYQPWENAEELPTKVAQCDVASSGDRGCCPTRLTNSCALTIVSAECYKGLATEPLTRNLANNFHWGNHSTEFQA